MNDVYYPDLSPLKTGVAGKCPRCGRGKLFNGYLTVADRCSSCGLSYEFADGGDGAAWFVMLFVCVAGVGSILGIEVAIVALLADIHRAVAAAEARDGHGAAGVRAVHQAVGVVVDAVGALDALLAR